MTPEPSRWRRWSPCVPGVTYAILPHGERRVEIRSYIHHDGRSYAVTTTLELDPAGRIVSSAATWSPAVCTFPD